MILNKNIVVNLLVVAAIGAIIFLSYQYWHVNREVRSSKAKIEGIQEVFDSYKKEALFTIEEKDIEISGLKEKAKKNDSLSKVQLASANHFKAKYETLKNSGYSTAKTAEDSLEVCLNVSDELFKEATHLRNGLEKAYVVIATQTKSIQLLEENIADYKILLANEETINEMLREHIKLMEKQAGKDKLKAGIFGMGIGAILATLAFIMVL